MMYCVCNIDHFLYQLPNLGLVNACTFDDEGAKRTPKEIELNFNKPGKLELVPPVSNRSKLSAGRRKHPQLW